MKHAEFQKSEKRTFEQKQPVSSTRGSGSPAAGVRRAWTSVLLFGFGAIMAFAGYRIVEMGDVTTGSAVLLAAFAQWTVIARA